MRIRSENTLPGLPESDRMLRQSMDGPQPAEYDTRPADSRDQTLAGFDAALGREISSRSDSIGVAGVTSAQRRSIDSNFTSELGKCYRVHPPLFVPFWNPGHGYLQAYESFDQNSQSRISVSHKVLLWTAVICHMRDSSVPAVASKDCQSITRLGSPWLLQREIS